MVRLPTDRVPVKRAIVVGAGPSGLAVAACLREQGVPFVVLERDDCIASLWQKRTYDRLKLHLPKRFCELPGMKFPDHYPEYPTSPQFISYLQDYATKFDITPEFNRTVLSANYAETSGIWRVRTFVAGTGETVEYTGHWLVVATGKNAESVVPGFPGFSDFAGEVIPFSEYTSGEAHRGKSVLVVGCGNSGMEVSLDLCDHGARPSMVVRDGVHVLPREVLGKSTVELAMILGRWFPLWIVDKFMVLLSQLVLGDLAKLGLRRPAAGPFELKGTHVRSPVLDNGAVARIRAGDIAVVPAISRFNGNQVEFVNGGVLSIDAVVLTGRRSNMPQATWSPPRNGYPRTAFPHGWNGEYGLYGVGFKHGSLFSASTEAISTAENIGKAWKKMETEPVAGDGQRISIAF
ncbi:hypothetical protein ACP70R_024119 [Stipagrostis hirtigluma subsp. patula]